MIEQSCKNALVSIARACNEELRGVDRKDLSTMTLIIDKHAEKAILIGFTKIELQVQIGYINKQLINRREDL